MRVFFYLVEQFGFIDPEVAHDIGHDLVWDIDVDGLDAQLEDVGVTVDLGIVGGDDEVHTKVAVVCRT